MDDLTYTLNPITTELGVGPTREKTKSVENETEIYRILLGKPISVHQSNRDDDKAAVKSVFLTNDSEPENQYHNPKFGSDDPVTRIQKVGSTKILVTSDTVTYYSARTKLKDKVK